MKHFKQLRIWTEIRQMDGQALVEILVAIAIASLMLPTLATALVTSRQGRVLGQKRVEATTLANYANDAVFSLREKGWTFIATNGTYHPALSAGEWSLVSGSETIGNYTRQIVVSDVYRDSSTGAIVTSGGILDPSTKKIVTTVSWTTPLSSSVSNTNYFQRYLGNATKVHTTGSDFNGGTKTNTVVNTPGGGVTHVQTAASSPADGTAVTSIVQAFSSNVTAGNLIAVSVTWGSNYTPTCSDSRGNIFTVVTNQHDASFNQSLAICYAINNNGTGADTITVSWPVASDYRRIVVNEYSGISTTTPLDVSASNIANGTTASNNVTSTAATTTASGDLIYGAVEIDDAAGPTSITAGTGFTQRNSVNGKELAVQDQIQVSAGSIASTQTFGAARRYLAQMVTFKAAGGQDGQVELAQVSSGYNWGSLSLAGSYDQPSSTTDALDVYVDSSTNRAYIVIGSTLRIINVATPGSPTLLGTYTAPGTVNGVYVATISSVTYAFLANAGNSSELTIVNVNNPASPTLAANVDLGGNNDANAVFVSGTYAYVARVLSSTSGQSEFNIVNVTTPTAPTVQGSVELTANANSVYVSGNYAYVATSITSAELTIINVTNKASPTSAGTFNTVGTTAIATDVFAVGTTVYLTEANNTSGGELFIINATTPASASQLGSYEAGAAINGVYVASNYAYITSAIASNQFRVLDVTTPSSITVVGSLNMTVTGSDLVQVGNYAYIASTSDTQELQIVQPAAISGYQPSGTFESATFDLGVSNAPVNRIIFTMDETGGDIKFQIAYNNDGSTWSYVGPDGTASTYFEANATPRFGTIGRYFRYKATFTAGNSNTTTGVLNDVTINYSP